LTCCPIIHEQLVHLQNEQFRLVLDMLSCIAHAQLMRLQACFVDYMLLKALFHPACRTVPCGCLLWHV